MAKEQARGLGGIYRRGQTWWVFYPVRGKQRHESSGSQKRSVAAALLKRRNGELGRGVVVDPGAERQAVAKLQEAYFANLQLKGRRSVASVRATWRNHLRPWFGDLRACEVTTELLHRYVADRQAAGAANASIVYSLRVLHRMFTLAVEEGRLPPGFPIPYMPTPSVSNTRRGFFERGDFERVASLLPRHVAAAARFAFLTGWRRGEVVGLEWCHVDLGDRTVTLPSERSKNYRARTIGLSGSLLALIEEQRALRRIDCAYVFHCGGRPLGDFRRAWQTACREAGVAGRHFHDLRRTAIRNFVRAGTPERVAMEISGHRTRAVFDRYNVVSARDTGDAFGRVDAYLEEQEAPGVTVLPATRSGRSR